MQPLYHIAKEPRFNTEEQITDYDKVEDYKDNGMEFYAVQANGENVRVDASEVRQLAPFELGPTLVQPVYVDDRMRAVVDVFDAIAGNASPMAMSETGQERAPRKTFAEALANLKSIVYGGVDNG